MSGTFEDVNINLYTCTYVLYAPVRACVQFSIQTFKYNKDVLSVLPSTCAGLCLIYGISSILCQLSQQVHPISQIHSCESKGELSFNNVILPI